jgi:hypothetical protein
MGYRNSLLAPAEEVTMAEQSDIPDWLQASQPATGDQAEQSEIPDWLQALRPAEVAGEEAPALAEEQAPAAFEEEEAPSPFADLRQKAGAPASYEEQEEPADEDATSVSELESLPSGATGTFSALRRKAGSQLIDYGETQAVDASVLMAMIRSLKPWQRFVVSLFLFLDVSIVGCLILLVLGRIAP